MAIAAYMNAPKVKTPTTTAPSNQMGMGQQGYKPPDPQYQTQQKPQTGQSLMATGGGLRGTPMPTGAPTAGQQYNPQANPNQPMAKGGGSVADYMQQPGGPQGLTKTGPGPQYGVNQPPAPTGPQPGQWQPPQYNAPTPTPGGNQAINLSNLFKGDKNIWNSDAFKSNDSQTANYLSSVLPVAQFDQNAYQYMQDFNEAQRRYNLEYGQTAGNNQFQQGLSTRQQQMAEWQAQEAANQFGQQLDWTKTTDQWSNDLAKQQVGIQGREADNTGRYQQGLIQNQAGLNQAQSQYWQGQNQNDAFANNATAQYQQGLIQNQGFANQTDAAAQRALAQYQMGQVNNQAFAGQTDRAAQIANAQYQQGQLGNERFGLTNQAAYQQGQLGNERFGLQNTAAYQQGQLGNERTQIGNQFTLGQQQNATDAAAQRALQQYQTGQLGNERYGLQNQFTLGQQANQTDAAAQRALQQYQTGQLGNERFGLQNQAQYQQGQLSNDRYGLQNTAQYQQGQIRNQAQDIANTGRYQQGQLTNEAAANRAQAQRFQGQTQNEMFANQAQAQYQQGQVRIGQQANTIDQMWKSGQLSNEQRGIALQELTQAQNNTFLNQQLAQQAQQAELERQNMLAIANTQAYGRSASPRASWARGWN